MPANADIVRSARATSADFRGIPVLDPSQAWPAPTESELVPILCRSGPCPRARTSSALQESRWRTSSVELRCSIRRRHGQLLQKSEPVPIL